MIDLDADVLPARYLARASVVIPAHNEAKVIGRLLGALDDRTLDVVVVCNGCTDETAQIVRAARPDVTLIDLREPSKHEALQAGNAASSVFPRVFVDADVEIDLHSVNLLIAAVGGEDHRLLAAAPARRIPRDRSTWIVRAYYDVWEQLPSVREGLFGRGVVAVAGAGFERLGELPPMMGDDLVIAEAFERQERAVIEDAVVTIHPPRSVRDLYRRRVRAATGNAQADAAGLRHGEARISTRDLLVLMRAQPRLIARVPVFVTMSVVGRIGARRAVRRGDFTTWARDESSRS